MSTTMTDDEKAAFLDRLRAQVGATGTPMAARDPVNQAAVRTWCDAMSEANPLYLDPDIAAAGPYGEVVAPPAMLQVWTMPGLRLGQQSPRDPREPSAGVYNLLDRAGYSSVVATNAEYVFHRYLRLGDHVTGTTKLVDVSSEKQTGLGIGHFVTTEVEYVDAAGDPVGSMFFRILKFRPGSGRSSAPEDDARRTALREAGLDPDEILPSPARPTRPRPQWNEDQAWFWEGLRLGELRIQRFVDDGTLVHPPANANPKTQSLEYDYIVASGRGRLYSHTVVHYPQVPSFDYPNVVGLVELDEGVRVVSNIVGVQPDQLEIGMSLEVCFPSTNSDDDIVLHQFRPARPERHVETRNVTSVQGGDRLPLCPVPLDPRLIVSTALATRDFQDVHHDRDAAQAKGAKDIFMNILTSAGISARWISDWAGPEARFENIKIRLGAPNHPYDTMTMSGQVTDVGADGLVTIGFVGRNSLGPHVTGTVDLRLP